MPIQRSIAIVVGLIAVTVAGFVAIAWRSAIAPIDPSAPINYDGELVKSGARLAALGNCIACHTVPGGKVFAGGLPLPTPFGTIYSTNITPEPETGLGRWSEAAFTRAMREGVDREGHHLYPAFPYDHYTLTTDADIRALYAYLMTRDPVQAVAPANDLVFPFNFRMLIAGWKLLYLDQGPFLADPNQGDQLNRGQYLAEGLAHCGGCHTPRNSLGAEIKRRHFSGGEAEGWHAYAIDDGSKAPVPWTKEELAFYLRNGWHELHGVSRGPMAEVTGNLAYVPDSDVEAISAYVVSLMGEPSPEKRQRGEVFRQTFQAKDRPLAVAGSQIAPAAAGNEPGEPIYNATCATCHDSGRPQPYGGLNLNLSTAVNAPNPQNIVNVVLYGLPPADGQPNSQMPAYAGVLNDQQIADLLAHMRKRFSKEPEWPDLLALVSRTRSGEHKVTIIPTDGIERSPANVGAEAMQ